MRSLALIPLVLRPCGRTAAKRHSRREWTHRRDLHPLTELRCAAWFHVKHRLTLGHEIGPARSAHSKRRIRAQPLTALVRPCHGRRDGFLGADARCIGDLAAFRRVQRLERAGVSRGRRRPCPQAVVVSLRASLAARETGRLSRPHTGTAKWPPTRRQDGQRITHKHRVGSWAGVPRADVALGRNGAPWVAD
jgi:hypothetical protein